MIAGIGLLLCVFLLMGSVDAMRFFGEYWGYYLALLIVILMVKDMQKRKAGRPKGSVQDERRKKSTITLPKFWWEWLNEQQYSQSETIQRALEDYKFKTISNSALGPKRQESE
jgi:hypothetical protein